MYDPNQNSDELILNQAIDMGDWETAGEIAENLGQEYVCPPNASQIVKKPAQLDETTRRVGEALLFGL